MNAIEIIRSHEQEIKERFSVRRIGVFGSNACGEAGAESDVGILVEFERPTNDHFMELCF